MLARSLAALAFLVACLSSCHSSSPTTAPPAPGSAAPEPSPGSATPEPGPSQSGPVGTVPALGEPCGANDGCATGTTCITYMGIAGARGPQFKTCEIRCEDDSKCPTGRHCATIADGPGRVCR